MGKNICVDLMPCIVRRADEKREDCSVCSELLGSEVVFLNRRMGSIDTKLVMSRLLFLRTRSPNGSVRLCVGDPNNSMATNVTVCSAVRCVGYSISAVYLKVTTDVNTFLLTNNTGKGEFTLPRSAVVVRRPSNNTRKRTARVRVITSRVTRAGEALGRLLTTGANRPVRIIRHSASQSGCVATRRTGTCKLVSNMIVRGWYREWSSYRSSRRSC